MLIKGVSGIGQETIECTTSIQRYGISLLLINSLTHFAEFLQTNADPYNAKRGFFFAHVGWLFVKKHKDVIEAGKKLNYDDLAADSTVRFQRALDPWFSLFMCFIMPSSVPMLWSENFWNGFWVSGALRYVIVLHFTWSVNSFAHLYGDRPYDPLSNPAENLLVSIVALGEGWHNWHHKYPFDYAASEFGVDQQFNPTKMFIDACYLLGLVTDCKRGTGAWAKLKLQRKEEKNNLPSLATDSRKVKSQ